MNNIKLKRTFIVILSLIAGIASSIIIFFLLISFFFSVGLWGWSDGGEKEYLERLERNTTITSIISLLIAAGIGFYIAYTIIRSKLKEKHSFPADTP